MPRDSGNSFGRGVSAATTITAAATIAALSRRNLRDRVTKIQQQKVCSRFLQNGNIIKALKILVRIRGALYIAFISVVV